MIAAVSKGRTGTAMQSFFTVLSQQQIEAVVDFIRREFMVDKAQNTRYHTVENGWANHDQYAHAYPFALGEIAIDTPWEDLSESQQRGKQLFMSSCITCHDRARVNTVGAIWELHAVSYPRNNFTPGQAATGKPGHDAVSQASAYAKHDIAPDLPDPSTAEKSGEKLFRDNCAFCHAADGTGMNWIGSFLEPHPRNLTDPDNMRTMTGKRLRQVIENGLPGTTMSAWKSVLSKEQIDQIIAYINRAFYSIAETEVTRKDM